MLRSILAQGKNWEISETVGRVESRLSTLGISKPRLEDLLSQIVIQKELLLQSKPAGSSADPPSDVSNNNGPPPSTAKQPSTLGKKNGYSKGCTPARSTRSGRKSAPENLIRSKWKPDSPFGPAIEDPSRPNSDTRTESNICLSSYLGDTSMPVKDRVHAFGQPIRTAAARPIPSLNLPANGNITASEASPGTLKLLPMRIYTPEESKLAGPLTPQYPVSASRNSFGGYPPWVLGDTPPRSCKGSLEETFHFGQPAADILDCSQKSIARPRTRPRSTSHVDRLKKLEGFTTEAASRAQNPITPPLRSPFQSVDCLSIPQEAPFGQISHGDLRVVRREGEGGEDWQRALEIPDSQSECFELDL
jgi:hypothetical protein